MRGMLNAMRVVARLALVIGLMAGLGGCSYLGNRGRDAKDTMDVGLTVTDKWMPDFGLYIDFFNMLPIGFSRVDGKLIGMCHRKGGWWQDYSEHSWGLLVYGHERRGAAFDPTDPMQARPDQANLTERASYDVGWYGRPFGDDPPPSRQNWECNRGFHVGWIGLELSLRLNEIIDFFVGWSGLDIMGDDRGGDAPPAPEAKPAA